MGNKNTRIKKVNKINIINEIDNDIDNLIKKYKK